MPLPEQFASLAQRLNNWGRWGEDDERGTLNFIDKSAVTRGYDSVRHWKSIGLFWQKSQSSEPWLPGKWIMPSLLSMTNVGTAVADPTSPCSISTDEITISAGSTSHFLSLSATSHAGRMYNGFDGTSVSQLGAGRLSATLIGPLLTRALFLDPARAAGVDSLAPGQKLTKGDLEAAVALAGTKPMPGDAVLIRTGAAVGADRVKPATGPGQLIHRLYSDDLEYGGSPGLSLDAAEWLHASQAAVVCLDTHSVDALPLDSPPLFLPVRLLLAVDLGMTIGLCFNLEEIGKTCAERGQYTGLFSCTPFAVAGSVTAPASAYVVV